jgi:hypothetical protein
VQKVPPVEVVDQVLRASRKGFPANFTKADPDILDARSLEGLLHIRTQCVEFFQAEAIGYRISELRLVYQGRVPTFLLWCGTQK